ncbi:unnamed protein product [Caenorhabditis angaria]|uniref:SGNH domain-containing protein n=1 Tax=Caenorhabditis angaria TaxID=860376 RepID=A0A9P1J382_9PELO|nr:unnamed protein product [Caenorhabditis angaria]
MKEKKEKEENDKIMTIYFIFMLLIVVLSPQSIFPEQLSRLLMSLFTAVFCYHCSELENSIFVSKPLVFLGDLSYVIYLIHWPIITVIRYTNLKDVESLDVSETIFILFLTFSITYFLHNSLEKKFISWTFSTSLIVIFIFSGLSYFSLDILKDQESIYSLLQPEELQKQIILNTKTEHLVKYVHNLPCIYEDDPANSIIEQTSCLHNSTGFGKILVIGNSLAIRAFPSIFEFLNGNYSQLRLYARTSSAPLSDANPAYTNDSIRVTKQMKPDLLWIIQGMNEIVFSHSSYKARMTDKILDKTTQRVLDKLKNNARIVAIDLPYYISRDNTSSILARKLLYGHEYEQSSIVKAAVVSNQIVGQTHRLLNLKCSNCYFTPVQESIMQNRTDFIKYDLETKAAIIHDGSHLSRITHRKFLYPSYMEHIRRFYSLFQLEKQQKP